MNKIQKCRYCRWELKRQRLKAIVVRSDLVLFINSNQTKIQSPRMKGILPLYEYLRERLGIAISDCPSLGSGMDELKARRKCVEKELR